MLRKLLSKIGVKKPTERRFKNRFQKFYYLHREGLNKERKALYFEKQKKGICVKCKKKAVKNSIFCKYHLEQSREYNRRRYRK